MIKATKGMCSNIRIMCQCDLYPLEPHFYIVKHGVNRGIHFFKFLL